MVAVLYKHLEAMDHHELLPSIVDVFAGVLSFRPAKFPPGSGSTHCKEINLSGWVSSEAAGCLSQVVIRGKLGMNPQVELFITCYTILNLL